MKLSTSIALSVAVALLAVLATLTTTYLLTPSSPLVGCWSSDEKHFCFADDSSMSMVNSRGSLTGSWVRLDETQVALRLSSSPEYSVWRLAFTGENTFVFGDQADPTQTALYLRDE